ncbi:MAG: hypothetical protein ACRDWB_08950, partial [Acidimicrobiales bacterium]
MAALSFPSPLSGLGGGRSRGGTPLRLVDGARHWSPGIDIDDPTATAPSPGLALVPDPVPRRRA